MPPLRLVGSVRRPARSAAGAFLWVVGALNMTCARPIASGSTAGAAPAAPSAAAASDEGELAPRPANPKQLPTTEHTELRTLGKVVARHVDRGFETLIVSTGEHVRCEGERLDSGAEVRIQGGSDTRRPWSGWFTNLPTHGADGNGNGAGDEGLLVVRRPLPGRGEHQIAHVHLPQACNGTPEHFRFALPDAEPHAADARAMQYWADAFARHVSGTAWGEFA